MYPLHPTPAGIAAPHSSPSRRSRIGQRLALLLAALLPLAAAPAIASDFKNPDGDPFMAAPWMPDVLLAADPYQIDPGFYLRRFQLISLTDLGNYPNSDYTARQVARLPDGNLVVAGLTPPYNAAAQANGLWNLGLELLSPTGFNRSWPDGGTYSHFFDYHLVYPGNANARIQAVRDIKVVGNYIYVLVDQKQTWAGNGAQDVYIETFTTDGRWLAEQRVLGTGDGTGNDIRAFYGVALVPISSNRMLVVTQGVDNYGPYVAVGRVGINTSGAYAGTTYTDPTWGNAYGTSGERVKNYFAPGRLCSSSVQTCNAVPIAATRKASTPTSTSDYTYIAGSVQYDGANDWDVFVLKISDDTGGFASNFGAGDGWQTYAYDVANSDYGDRTRGLFAWVNDMYIAVRVSRRCSNGVGLIKASTTTSSLDASFPGGGKILIGGDDGTGTNPVFCAALAYSYDSFGMTGGGAGSSPDRVGIVGHGMRTVAGTTTVDPALTVVSTSGEVISQSTYTVRAEPVGGNPGVRKGDAILYDAIPGPAGTASFTVVGEGRDTTQGNRLRFLTGQLSPVSADTIFKNGFDPN